ncbi:hypothetical protein GBF38_010798 [Nibea albiflora]|uniref:Uncharacterized protein n=1 Tax=Nibea albiflora TaxID=240163 RepID=A0ACB7ET60_NIBAL|nr:hypothetical protein GBF38_010798 [Nibea albiflora]
MNDGDQLVQAVEESKITIQDIRRLLGREGEPQYFGDRRLSNEKREDVNERDEHQKKDIVSPAVVRLVGAGCNIAG